MYFKPKVEKCKEKRRVYDQEEKKKKKKKKAMKRKLSLGLELNDFKADIIRTNGIYI